MSDRFAIIADYRGFAVCEREGNVTKVWEGIVYHTDGMTYLLTQTELDNKIAGFGFHQEVQVRDFIDLYLDSPDTLLEEIRKLKLLSYEQAYFLIHKQPNKEKTPISFFDEERQAFVNINGARDGQHRFTGIKKL